jgi:hypothetical protein
MIQHPGMEEVLQTRTRPGVNGLAEPVEPDLRSV